MRPCPCVAHHRERGLHEPHRALDRRLERHVEVGVGEVLHRHRRVRRHCVGHDAVDRAELAHRGIDEREVRGPVTGVGGAGDVRRAEVVELRRQRRQSLGAACRHHEPRPAAREVPRDPTPDAPRRAGDDDDLAVEIVHDSTHAITPVQSAPVMTPAINGQVVRRHDPGLRRDHRRHRVQRPHEGGEAEAAHVAAAPVHLDVDGVGGHALQDDAVAAQRRRVPRPVGCRVLTHPRDVLEHDALLTVLHADQTEPHRADGARGQRSRRGLVRLGRDPLLQGVVDAVELQPVRGGEAPHDRRPEVVESSGFLQRRDVVGRMGEAHEVVHDVGLRDRRVVEDLLHRDLVDAGARGAEHERHHVVDPARLDAAVEQRRAAVTTRLLEHLPHVVLGRGRIAERHERRGHHVLARAQAPRDVVGRLAVSVVTTRVVRDRVGVDGQRGVDVARRDDAGGGETAQVAGVAAVLRLAVHDEAGELEAGVLDQRSQRPDPHLARDPTGSLACRPPNVVVV